MLQTLKLSGGSHDRLDFQAQAPLRPNHWGYGIGAGRDAKGKRIQFFKSGFETRGAAKDALQAAIAERESAGSVTQQVDPFGKRVWAFRFGDIRKSGFATQAGAEAGLRDEIRAQDQAEEAKRAAVVADGEYTVSKYLQHWLDEHASRNCSPKTLERYRELARYIDREIGSTGLNRLTTAQIQAAVHSLSDHGGRKTPDHSEGRPLAPKTVRHIGTLLYTALSEAERLGIMTISHPMANKRVKLPKLVKKTVAVVDESKLGLLFERAQTTRLYPFVVLAASTGCRRGELLALEWSDIDFETGDVRISKSLEQTKTGLRIKSTKSGEPRHFSVPDWALDVLREHREVQDSDRRMFGTDYRDRNLVFCQPSGDFYSPDRDRRPSRGTDEEGRPRGREPSLSAAYACAANLLSKGVPIAVVSERLGHANQNITLSIYSHAMPADKRAAAKIWEMRMAM